MSDEAPWLKKARQKLEEKVQESQIPEEFLQDAPELDDKDSSQFESSELRNRIKSTPLIDIYRKIHPHGKFGRQVTGSKGIEQLISCPLPAHGPDNDPSAQINISGLNTWHCHKCQVSSGDAYDMVAGILDVPRNANMAQISDYLCDALGFQKYKSITGKTIYAEVSDEPEPPRLATVPDISPVVLAEQPEDNGKPIDWRSLAPEGTFIREYMTEASKDDCPEEYHFWNSLLAIGMAVGRDTYFLDRPRAYANLYICLLGQTGIGKSKSKSFLEHVISEALPYDDLDPDNKGVRRLAMPGSGEALIDAFSKPIPDAKNPKKVVGYGAIRGLLTFDEFSNFMSRSERVGSSLKAQVIELYDCKTEISSASRTHGTSFAKNPYCSILTTTQNRAVRDITGRSDADSGFLNRWIFATGVPKQRYVINRVVTNTTPAAMKLKAIHEWSADHHAVTPDDHAEEILSKFFNETIWPAIKTSSDNDSMLSRADLLMKKLMLIFAINEGLEEFTVDVVNKAIYLWDYLFGAYQRFSEALATTDMGDLRDKILEVIPRKVEKIGRNPTKRDIFDAVGRKKFTDKDIVTTLKNMVELGLLGEEAPKQAGRGHPSGMRYYIEP